MVFYILTSIFTIGSNRFQTSCLEDHVSFALMALQHIKCIYGVDNDRISDSKIGHILE